MGPREGWTPAALSSAATSRKACPQEWPQLSCQLRVWVWLNEVTETVAGPQNQRRCHLGQFLTSYQNREWALMLVLCGAAEALSGARHCVPFSPRRDFV